MTYWLTLWYAGAVVMTMGYEGQTLGECKKLTAVILTDIASTYQDTSVDMNDTMFPEDFFSVTCETKLFPIDEMYAE